MLYLYLFAISMFTIFMLAHGIKYRQEQDDMFVKPLVIWDPEDFPLLEDLEQPEVFGAHNQHDPS